MLENVATFSEGVFNQKSQVSAHVAQEQLDEDVVRAAFAQI